ncbi:MAG: sulfotransferase [Myxococcota bacterium]
MSSPRSPIIVIGMLRSGTTMSGGLLEALGAFMGVDQEWNGESLFFRRLNEWMVEYSGGNVEFPDSYLLARRHRRLMELHNDYLRVSIDSPRAFRFLGWKRYWRYRGLSRIDEPWGWKDPLTTITLPNWLAVFPNARVVCLRRHGVDVAASLRTRHRWMFDRAEESYRKRRWLYRFKQKDRGFADLRAAFLGRGFSMWELYNRQVSRYLALYPEQTLEVHYEKLLADPANELGPIAAFCGIDTTPEAVARVAASVKPSRAFAYQKDRELARFARAVEPRLARYGYKA